MIPTAREVAKEAGVSLATVDRVLNGRAGVRQSTVARVEAAIERIGFVRDLGAANLSKRRSYRFVFIVPEGANSFMRALEAQIAATASLARTERIGVEVVAVPPFDGVALARALAQIVGEGVSGVALVATEAPVVRDQLGRLAAAGIPVVTLVSDAPTFPRQRFIGIDNVAAGRTAARLLGNFVNPAPGRLVVLVGSMLVRDHVERRMGFEQIVRTEFPHLEILPILETRDDPAIAAAVLDACLARNENVVGLYNIGAGNRGAIDILSRLPAERRPITVVHELGPYSRAALAEGLIHAIINQDPGHEARSAVRILKALVDGSPIVEAQEHIRIEIYLRDNLP